MYAKRNNLGDCKENRAYTVDKIQDKKYNGLKRQLVEIYATFYLKGME